MLRPLVRTASDPSIEQGFVDLDASYISAVGLEARMARDDRSTAPTVPRSAASARPKGFKRRLDVPRTRAFHDERRPVTTVARPILAFYVEHADVDGPHAGMRPPLTLALRSLRMSARDLQLMRTIPRFALPLLLIAGLVAANLYSRQGAEISQVPYSAFLTELEQEKLQKVEVRGREIVAELKAEGDAAPQKIRTTRLPGIDESKLVEQLHSRGVEFVGRADEPSVWPLLLGWLMPFLIIFGIYFFLFRRISKNIGSSGGPFGVGKSKAKRFDATEDTKVTFSDVAGIDESVAEMKEVVDFLKNPGRYQALGAKIPKGVLLVGPPGTGKTLLAKAVAGEAGVPFYSLSGSDFVEMFVGVGAARVRDLFEQAQGQSPCIIFIDEIDGIGKSRGGAAAFGGHDEREQTLNQLLSEMDGFDARSGIVIIAATNRPEVLDQALVRAGRFDRQVVVDRPSVDGRLAISESTRSPGAAWRRPSTCTWWPAGRPGMVGADLAKVVNEAALGRRPPASQRSDPARLRRGGGPDSARPRKAGARHERRRKASRGLSRGRPCPGGHVGR